MLTAVRGRGSLPYIERGVTPKVTLSGHRGSEAGHRLRCSAALYCYDASFDGAGATIRVLEYLSRAQRQHQAHAATNFGRAWAKRRWCTQPAWIRVRVCVSRGGRDGDD